jgi:ribosome-binding factor A
MVTQRQLRVAEEIKRLISQILGRGAKDPRIGFVSVTGVEVSRDLRKARVFVSVYGNKEDVQKTLAGLESARGYIQREMGGKIRCRYTPVISFHLDRSISYGTRIDAVIDKLHQEKGQLPEADANEDNEGSR